MPTPPDRAHASRHQSTNRRNRSQQRDHILSWLRTSDAHPSAAQVHIGLARELPDLSLGTVYRNLEVLVAEGAVEEVACAGGVARYDANLEPHHHFHCERCQSIVDIDLPAPRGLVKRLAETHSLEARRASISFFGLCAACDRMA